MGFGKLSLQLSQHIQKTQFRQNCLPPGAACGNTPDEEAV
jgi:hypothetical protein